MRRGYSCLPVREGHPTDCPPPGAEPWKPTLDGATARRREHVIILERDIETALAQAIAQRIGEPRYKLWFERHTRFRWADDLVTVGVPKSALLKNGCRRPLAARSAPPPPRCSASRCKCASPSTRNCFRPPAANRPRCAKRNRPSPRRPAQARPRRRRRPRARAPRRPPSNRRARPSQTRGGAATTRSAGEQAHAALASPE